MTDVAELLDRAVPPYEGRGDWHRVLRDAGVEPHARRRPYRLAAVVAVIAAIAGAVAFWPQGGTGGSVIDRALAAAGTGQVLHLVYEGELPRTLVDLETGQRIEMRSQHEVWFDPEAGLRETETFHGVVQFDTALSRDEVPGHATAVYSSLGAGYREALESGQARVVGEDTLDGNAVYWIRIATGHDVAVSRDSFAPLAIRVTQDGVPALTRILTYETAAAGSAPLDATPAAPGPANIAPQLGPEIDLARATRLLGHAPVWAGSSAQGLRLESVRELTFPTTDAEMAGIGLVYGSEDGAHVEIQQAAGLAEGLTMLVGVRGYAPAEGSALVAGNQALLWSNGLVVAIHAPDEETAISIARVLEPYSG